MMVDEADVVNEAVAGGPSRKRRDSRSPPASPRDKRRRTDLNLGNVRILLHHQYPRLKISTNHFHLCLNPSHTFHNLLEYLVISLQSIMYI